MLNRLNLGQQSKEGKEGDEKDEKIFTNTECIPRSSWIDLSLYPIQSSPSVYYASHMPRKEETQPELVMALENINWIDKQNTENIYFHENREGVSRILCKLQSRV